MKRFFTLKLLLLTGLMGTTTYCFPQVNGDFQTKNATGNWSDFNAWDIYSGGWISAVSGQIPNSTSNVYVRSNHTISVDNNSAVCNTLNIDNSNGATVSFGTSSCILHIKGNFTINSTANCFGTWAAGAKIVFSGTGNQTLPDNLGTYSVLNTIEVNKSSGTLTSGNSFKFNTFVLTYGNFDVLSGADVRGNSSTASITINGGIWTQVSGMTRTYSGTSASPKPIGAITINGGSMVLFTTSTTTSSSPGGLQFSSVSVTNGGGLTLLNFGGNLVISTSFSVDATSSFNTALTTTPLPPTVTFNGTVNYNNPGDQTISAATYSYLKLSGIGGKTLGTGTTTIPANGTLEMSGGTTSPTFYAGGNTLNVSATSSNLIYSSAGSQTATMEEWSSNFQNVTINNISASGVSMAGLTRSISGSLNLTNGNFDIGAGGALTLNGASLNRVNGFLNGMSTSDLTVAGTTGGTVLLPLSGNISLRNIAVSGTRTLAMDGVNHIYLNGTFNIGTTSTYDNGGESQIRDGGGSILIDGKFLNRDKDNFAGPNGAIPGINPTLNATSTIEFGLSGNQIFTARSDFKNITFSGSGIKTPSNTFTPTGTLTITGSAILDATNHNIGDGVVGTTNFIMDGGRLILGTTNTQPMMNGLYNLTGGIVEFNVSGAVTQSIRSLKTYYAIEITGDNVGNSLGNINLAPNGSFTVKSGGTFIMNSDAIVGATGIQVVIIENGGIFKCGNDKGFHGFVSTSSNFSSLHQNIENIILNPGSTVEYTRLGDQPITTFNGLVYENLSLSGSGNKTAPSGVLTINGDLTKTGTCTFLHNNGTVLLNGNSTQNFAGLTYNNLLLSNSTKITAGKSTIIDSVKINSGATLSISNNDTIILHSDAARTARLGQLNGGVIDYNTSGAFIVERFISSRRAWRFLSIPVNTTQTIKNQWQEGATSIGMNPKPNYGTQITDNNSGTFAANGFDAYSQGGPSVKYYDINTDTYIGIASTNTTFDLTKGPLMTFVRGDRTATGLGSLVTSTVLRTAGQLFTGPQPNINVIQNKFVAINNPYASAIDLRKISQSPNLFFYVWDPNRGGVGYGLGAYQTLSWNGTGYTVVPGNSGSYGMINNFIESGQAFFVGTLGANTSLPLDENAKSDATFAIAPFTPAGIPGQQLFTTLYSVAIDGSTSLADGVFNSFDDNYNNGLDGMDARKLTNFGENLAIIINQQSLAVERRKTIYSNDTLFYKIWGLRPSNYRLKFVADQMDHSGVDAYLEDSYLQSHSLLNLNGTTDVDFTVDANAGSFAQDRFRIVFEEAAGPLPVSFTNVKAYRQVEDIAVDWNVENENNIKQYEVEKSGNGTVFITGGTIVVQNTGSYNWIDLSPLPGSHYYRIKSIDVNDKIQYSKTVQVLIPERRPAITIYPNPVKGGVVHLHFVNQPAGHYGLRIMNKAGQVMVAKEVDHAANAGVNNIDLEFSAAQGIYDLDITMPDHTKILKKIIR